MATNAVLKGDVFFETTQGLLQFKAVERLDVPGERPDKVADPDKTFGHRLEAADRHAYAQGGALAKKLVTIRYALEEFHAGMVGSALHGAKLWHVTQARLQSLKVRKKERP